MLCWLGFNCRAPPTHSHEITTKLVWPCVCTLWSVHILQHCWPKLINICTQRIVIRLLRLAVMKAEFGVMGSYGMEETAISQLFFKLEDFHLDLWFRFTPYLLFTIFNQYPYKYLGFAKFNTQTLNTLRSQITFELLKFTVCMITVCKITPSTLKTYASLAVMYSDCTLDQVTNEDVFTFYVEVYTVDDESTTVYWHVV